MCVEHASCFAVYVFYIYPLTRTGRIVIIMHKMRKKVKNYSSGQMYHDNHIS